MIHLNSTEISDSFSFSFFFFVVLSDEHPGLCHATDENSPVFFILFLAGGGGNSCKEIKFLLDVE